MLRGACRELGEGKRVVDVGERVVKEQRVRARGERRRFGADGGRGLVLAAQPREQAPGGRDPLLRLFDAVELEGEQLAQGLAQPVAGQRVVADERDAAGRQHVRGEREQPLAHRVGHPRVDAVRDDVVEALLGRLEVLDPDLLEAHVGEAELVRARSGQRDRAARQVEADEARLGQRERHAEQVAAVAAADLEHATARGRDGVQAEQRRDRRDAIGMRLRERVAGVADGLVAPRVVRDGAPPAAPARSRSDARRPPGPA